MESKKQFTEVMKDLQGYFKKGERLALYNIADNPKHKLLIRLLWKTGRRVGEILKLQVKDIVFEDKNILWHIEKKGRPTNKLKPIDEFTLNLLRDYIKENNLGGDAYIIHGHSYVEPMTRQRVFQLVRKYCSKIGIEYVGTKRPHPHHFRHSFAIDIVRRATSPADVRKLQLLLEHSNLTTTESYLQFSSEDLRSLIEEEDEG